MNLHSVQSSRIQQIIKGDDVTLLHQIIQSASLYANSTLVPVAMSAGDIAHVFYPLADLTITDLIGYLAVPQGTLPSSMIQVFVPGNIPINNPTPARGSQSFQAGLSQTVRVEITRLKASLTGNITNLMPQITSLSSTAALAIGMSVVGTNIPVGAIIISIDSGSQVTLSTNATATASGVSLTFGQKESHYLINEVDIFERGFASSLIDTSGGTNPPSPELNLT